MFKDLPLMNNITLLRRNIIQKVKYWGGEGSKEGSLSEILKPEIGFPIKLEIFYCFKICHLVE